MAETEQRKLYVYIITNDSRTALCSGVTSEMNIRLMRHKEDVNNKANNVPARNGCCYLVYFEIFGEAKLAALRQYQLSRTGKIAQESMVSEFNPGWVFLNEDFETNRVVGYSYKVLNKFVNKTV